MADVLCYSGLTILLTRLTGLSLWVGWGTGTGTSARTDTSLFTAASEARVAASVSKTTIAQADDTLVITGTISANGPKTITNAGVWSALAAGSLILKSDFAGIAMTLVPPTSLTFTFKLRIK